MLSYLNYRPIWYPGKMAFKARGELFVVLHLEFSAQLMSSARKSKDVCIKGSLQAGERNVVKTCGRNQLTGHFLAVNAQERLLHFLYKCLQAKSNLKNFVLKIIYEYINIFFT